MAIEWPSACLQIGCRLQARQTKSEVKHNDTSGDAPAEVAFRVTDLPRVLAFYQEVLGLEIVRAYPTMVFLKVGDLESPLGRGGHPQLLVLFDRQVQLDIALTTLDHIAFEILLEQYPAERLRLQQFGLELTERIWRGEYAWLRARSLFFDDPHGNTIELIAHDPNAAETMPSS